MILGLTINPKKSRALDISLSKVESDSDKNVLPFIWTERSIPYLGVHLTASYSDLFVANYPPLLKQITKLLQQGTHLLISWIGKINAIRMTILPKLLYLCRVLPISIPSYYLRFLQKKDNNLCVGLH